MDTEPLTEREKEVLKYIGEGYPNKSIAVIMGVSERTIANHVSSSMRKLGAQNRTHAFVLSRIA